MKKLKRVIWACLPLLLLTVVLSLCAALPPLYFKLGDEGRLDTAFSLSGSPAAETGGEDLYLIRKLYARGRPRAEDYTPVLSTESLHRRAERAMAKLEFHPCFSLMDKAYKAGAEQGNIKIEYSGSGFYDVYVPHGEEGKNSFYFELEPSREVFTKISCVAPGEAKPELTDEKIIKAYINSLGLGGLEGWEYTKSGNKAGCINSAAGTAVYSDGKGGMFVTAF